MLGKSLRSLGRNPLLQKSGMSTWAVLIVKTPEVNGVSIAFCSLLQAPLRGAHFPIQISATIHTAKKKIAQELQLKIEGFDYVTERNQILGITSCLAFGEVDKSKTQPDN